MALVVTHGFSSAIADDPAASAAGEVLPSHWNANHTLTGVATPSQGGTGVANNDASTLTISGSFPTTVTVSATSSVTLPTSGALAVLASPAFTGVPTAPTATAGTNTTQLATTAFVLANGGAIDGFTSDGTTLTGSGQTVTANAPILDLTQTWNATASAFIAVRLNVTDTASPASNGGTALLDLQVDSNSKFKIDKYGNIVWTTANIGLVTSGGLFQIANAALNALGNFSSRKATLTSGTVTANEPALDITQTWNATASAFTAVKLNVTNTLSSTSSLLMDLQVGATSKFTVDYEGGILIAKGGNYNNVAIAFGTLNTGIYGGSSGLNVEIDGAVPLKITSSTVSSHGTFALGSASGAADTFMYRDAADVIGHRNGTTAQAFNLYDTYASDTDYHRVAIRTARATLSNVSGASVTATGLIPDGAVVVGVTSKVTTGLGTGNGTTGYTIGDGTTANRWGAITGTVAGTSSDNTNWTVTTIQAFTAASDVVVTATGGNFDATGVIYVSVQYLIGQCD